MSGREQQIKKLLDGVERLLSEVEHHVPPEVTHVEGIKKLIKELRDGSEQPEG